MRKRGNKVIEVIISRFPKGEFNNKSVKTYQVKDREEMMKLLESTENDCAESEGWCWHHKEEGE